MSGAYFNDIQYKASSGQVNLDQAQGIVECFVAGIGNKDSVGDVCATGAFAKSLLRRKPRVVWGHNWNDPIGKVLEIYEVPPNDPRLPGKMKAAGIGGLYAKVQFNLNSEKGREAFANVAFFGEEQEWSIGYKTLRAQFDQNSQANILYEVELYEVSPVLHGANQLTGTISVKNAEKGGTAVMPIPSGPMDMPEDEVQRKLQKEMSDRFGFAVKISSVEDGVVTFTREGEEDGSTYKCGFHHQNGTFMLGRPERIQMPMGMPMGMPMQMPQQPKPQAMPMGMPSKPMAAQTPGMTVVVPQALPGGTSGQMPIVEIEYEDDDDDDKPKGKPKLIREEADLAEALIRITERHGKFDEDGTGVWAGYKPAAENTVAKIGVKCSNCVMYEGNGSCKIIAQKVEDNGKCRFAVIPEGVVKVSPIKKQEAAAQKEQEEVKWLKDVEDKYPDVFLSGELRSALKRKRDAANQSVKMIPISNYSTKSLRDDSNALYYVSVTPETAFEIKNAIDPIIDYYRAEAFVDEDGIVFTSGVNKDFAEAIDTAVKALGRNLAGKITRSARGLAARFDPKAWDGDNDGIVQEGTPYERPAIPGVNDFSTRGRVNIRKATQAWEAQGGSTTKPKATRDRGMSSGRRSLTRHSSMGAANEAKFPNKDENTKRESHEAFIKEWENGMGLPFTTIDRQPSEKGPRFTEDWMRSREVGYNDAKARWMGKGTSKRPPKVNDKQRSSTDYASWYMDVVGQLGRNKRERGTRNTLLGYDNEGHDAGVRTFLNEVSPTPESREIQAEIDKTLKDAGFESRMGLSSGRRLSSGAGKYQSSELPESALAELQDAKDKKSPPIKMRDWLGDLDGTVGDFDPQNDVEVTYDRNTEYPFGEDLPGHTIRFGDGSRGVIVWGSDPEIEDTFWDEGMGFDIKPGSIGAFRTHDKEGNLLDEFEVLDDDMNLEIGAGLVAKESDLEGEYDFLIEDNVVSDETFAALEKLYNERGLSSGRRLSSGATNYKDEETYKKLSPQAQAIADAIQEESGDWDEGISTWLDWGGANDELAIIAFGEPTESELDTNYEYVDLGGGNTRGFYEGEQMEMWIEDSLSELYKDPEALLNAAAELMIGEKFDPNNKEHISLIKDNIKQAIFNMSPRNERGLSSGRKLARGKELDRRVNDPGRGFSMAELGFDQEFIGSYDGEEVIVTDGESSSGDPLDFIGNVVKFGDGRKGVLVRSLKEPDIDMDVDEDNRPEPRLSPGEAEILITHDKDGNMLDPSEFKLFKGTFAADDNGVSPEDYLEESYPDMWTIYDGKVSSDVLSDLVSITEKDSFKYDYRRLKRPRETTRGLSSGQTTRARGIDYRQGDPEQVGTDLERLSQRSDDLGANFRHLRDMAEEESIQFEYRGKMREVRPDPNSGGSLFNALKRSRDGALYFIGIDSESGEPRSFRLDRIDGLIVGADYGGYNSGWDGSGFNEDLPRALRGLGSGRSSGRVDTSKVDITNPRSISEQMRNIDSRTPVINWRDMSLMDQDVVVQNTLDNIEDAMKLRKAIIESIKEKHPKEFEAVIKNRGNQIQLGEFFDVTDSNGDPIIDPSIEDLADELDLFLDAADMEISDQSDLVSSLTDQIDDLEAERRSYGNDRMGVDRDIEERRNEIEDLREQLRNSEISIDEYNELLDRLLSQNEQDVEEINGLTKQIEDIDAQLRNAKSDLEEAEIFGNRYQDFKDLEAENSVFGAKTTPRERRRAGLASGRRQMSLAEEDALNQRNDIASGFLNEADERAVDASFDQFMQRPARERAKAFAQYRKETGMAANPQRGSFRRWIADLEEGLISRDDNAELSARDRDRGLSSGRIGGPAGQDDRTPDQIMFDRFVMNNDMANMSDEEIAKELNLDVADVAASRESLDAEFDQIYKDLEDYYASRPEPTDEELQAQADDYERRQIEYERSQMSPRARRAAEAEERRRSKLTPRERAELDAREEFDVQSFRDRERGLSSGRYYRESEPDFRRLKRQNLQKVNNSITETEDGFEVDLRDRDEIYSISEVGGQFRALVSYNLSRNGGQDAREYEHPEAFDTREDAIDWIATSISIDDDQDLLMNGDRGLSSGGPRSTVTGERFGGRDRYGHDFTYYDPEDDFTNIDKRIAEALLKGRINYEPSDQRGETLVRQNDEVGSNARRIAEAVANNTSYGDIERQDKITFTYNGKLRSVYPERFSNNSKGVAYFTGWDENANNGEGEYRNFVITNIEDIVSDAILPSDGRNGLSSGRNRKKGQGAR